VIARAEKGTTPVQTASKEEELEKLRSRVQELEDQLLNEAMVPQAEITRDYSAYHATAGFSLGILGAMTSLVFNVIGSLVFGKNPLELIRVYLTFPLGERALQLATANSLNVYAVGDGLIVALGCCLYLATGMILGVPVSLALSKFAARGSWIARLAVGGIASLAIWAINFYAILSWLQPLLFGGRWIVDNSLLPWWVAGATHLVFGATIGVLYPIAAPPKSRTRTVAT
jgi:hypothetical protein